MEIQWPLIIFTTLLAASAGVFATQGIYALAGKGAKAQIPSLIVSAVLLVVGGVAVLFHLQHFERIFNGFGHMTSGITQELIAVVIVAIVMIVYVIATRSVGKTPKWSAIIAICASVLLVLAMGMSYMMPSRPAWNNVLQIFSLYGLACVVGPGTFVFIEHLTCKEKASGEGKDLAAVDHRFDNIFILGGSIIAAVLTIAFIISMTVSVSQFVDVGNHFDPNHPTAGMTAASSYSPFAGDALVFTIIVIILALLAVVFAVIGMVAKKWPIIGLDVAICGIACGFLLRIVLYICGGDLFMIF